MKQPKPLATPAQVEQAILEACNNDLDLAMFYITWMKHERNASKAYKELHPHVDDHSARVLGSRLLAKVDKPAALQAYNLGYDRYFTQLDEGLKATKWNDFTGEREPDHATRRPYHDKLGKLLGIENDKAAGQQFNAGTIQIINYQDQS